jgi:hypothetical protein
MVNLSRFGVCVGAIIAIAVAPSHAAVDPAPAPQQKLSVVGSTVLLVEPNADAGATTIDVRNDDVARDLCVASNQGGNGTASIALSNRTDDVHRCVALAPGITPVTLRLTGSSSDEFNVELFAGADKVLVPVHHKAFTLHVADSKAAVALIEDVPVDIGVINDDHWSHDVTWQLRIDSRTVCQGRSLIAAKSPAVFRCTPHFEWSQPTKLSSLFRPLSVTTATLVTTPGDGNQDSPFASLPLTGVTAQWFGPAGQVASYLLVIAILGLGGVVSLLLSQILPNRLARVSLREKLEELDRIISGLSGNIESSLRVLMRVERSRLIDLLYTRAS